MHLRPWARADVPVCAAILAEGNRTDTLSRYLRPNFDTMDTSYHLSCFRFLRREWLAQGRHPFVLISSLEELQKTNDEASQSSSTSSVESQRQDHTGVSPNETSGTEVVVGWAWFSRKGTSEAAKSWQKNQLSASLWIERILVAAEGHITDFVPNYDPVNDRKRRGVLDPLLKMDPWDETIFAESWEVDGLFVDVKYQRRGYARIMLDWVFEQARKEQVPVRVKGSPRGGLAYRKHGFRSIGEVGFHRYFDELEFGGENHQLWVWEPEDSEGKWWERAKQRMAEQDGKLQVV